MSVYNSDEGADSKAIAASRTATGGFVLTAIFNMAFIIFIGTEDGDVDPSEFKAAADDI